MERTELLRKLMYVATGFNGRDAVISEILAEFDRKDRIINKLAVRLVFAGIGTLDQNIETAEYAVDKEKAQ